MGAVGARGLDFLCARPRPHDDGAVDLQLVKRRIVGVDPVEPPHVVVAGIVDLAQMADVVFTPIADTKVFPDGVDVTLVEGAICNTDHVEMIQTVRARTRVLASLGDCAITGNVSALRNVWPVDVVLRNAAWWQP